MNAALHNLTGAYAAQALADTERVSFERHLDACPGCAQEVRELAETTARLGAAVATAPPPGLWDRVRAEALATRQVPPVTRRAGGGGRARQGRAVPALRFRPLLVAAAVLLVAVLSVTAVNLGVLGRSDRTERTADLVAAVLAAPDARRVAAGPGGPGRASVVVSRGGGRRCSWPAGCGRLRRAGPTSSGWSAGRGHGRRGWPRWPVAGGWPGCWTGRSPGTSRSP